MESRSFLCKDAKLHLMGLRYRQAGTPLKRGDGKVPATGAYEGMGEALVMS